MRARVNQRIERGHELSQIHNQHSEAVVELEKALDLDPENWRAQFEIGLAYLGLNDLSKAIDALEATLRLCPQDLVAETQLRLGHAYRRRHEASGKESDFLRAQTCFTGAGKNPATEAESLHHLGMLYLQKGLHAEPEGAQVCLATALRYLRSLIERHPSYAKIEEVRKIVDRFENIQKRES